VQPAVVDALLEVDAHGAERGQGAAPVVARVDVLGADLDRVALGDVVHGISLIVLGAVRPDGRVASIIAREIEGAAPLMPSAEPGWQLNRGDN
jgi:hypothetical protein